jgi:hypothetical protein
VNRFTRLVMIVALAACSSHGDHASDQAADSVVAKEHALAKASDPAKVDQTSAELARANDAFEMRKDVRMIGLRTEQSIIAPQGDMISSLAAQLPLTDAARNDIDAKVEALAHSVDDAKQKTADLESATVEQWKSRDNATGVAMKQLETARDAAWKAFKQAKRTDHAS